MRKQIEASPVKETIGAIYSEVILKHLSSYTTYKTEITSSGIVMGEMTRSKPKLIFQTLKYEWCMSPEPSRLVRGTS